MRSVLQVFQERFTHLKLKTAGGGGQGAGITHHIKTPLSDNLVSKYNRMGRSLESTTLCLHQLQQLLHGAHIAAGRRSGTE